MKDEIKKINEDNFIQLDDYGATFCEREYMQESCYISLIQFKSSDQFNPPPPESSQILDICSVVVL